MIPDDDAPDASHASKRRGRAARRGDSRGGARGGAKLQRWVDLIAALLSRHAAASFEELANDVPAYWFALQKARSARDRAAHRRGLDSLKRTFERDKDELRTFGVPIETHEDPDGNGPGAYRLGRKDFYLPYLCVAGPGSRQSVPRKVDRYGYRALSTLTFEAEELHAVVRAAVGVRALGDPLLAAEVESALRKLAVDLPVDVGVTLHDEPHVVLARARPDAAVFEALGEALRRRKFVRFDYHAMSTDRTEERVVAPYGLFFVNAHWYLAGHDRSRGELRNFRLNRMDRVRVNTQRPQQADFAVPSHFRLREHARSRHAWELGDGDATHAEVRFIGRSGPTVAAMRLGEPVDGDPTRRGFSVRRPDTFVRWLLSFAGEAVPWSPDHLVTAYAAAIDRVAALYAPGRGDAGLARQGSIDPSHARPSAGRAAEGVRATSPPAPRAEEPAASAWHPAGAAAQLRRILHLIPQIADGEEHSLRAVAERVGTTVEVLQRDLHSLVNRFDAPGGFVEGVQLYVGADSVSATSNHLLRPMRLTGSELCALELGLAVLRTRRPPDEHEVLDRARDRLRKVITRLADDPLPELPVGVELARLGPALPLTAVRRALGERRRLRLVYRRSGQVEPGERVVCPYALVASSGMLYVIAHCERESGIRVFRMDRIEEALATGEAFERPDDFSVEAVVRDGRVFQHEAPEALRVRYGPRVARWIAEREGRALAADGSLVMEHPLADREWGLRHVLQYDADAEVLAPAAMRDAMAERLEAMGAALRNP